MLAHFLHLLDQAPCPFHTLCLNFTEFQYFSSSFLGSRSATASCPASGSASASSSTGTSPILGRADFYLQSILFTSQKGAFQLRSNFSERVSLQVLTKIISLGVTSSRKLTTRTGRGACGTHIIMIDDADAEISALTLCL